MKTACFDFFVGTRPTSVHFHVDEREGWARRFYASQEPLLFLSWVWGARRSLDSPLIISGMGEGPLSAERATAIEQRKARFTLGFVLECLFAHFFANVQAAYMPQAWLDLYDTGTLLELTESVAGERWSHNKKTLPLKHADEFVGWLFTGTTSSELSEPSPEHEADVAAIREGIRRLAREFLNKDARVEYNALKHGARTGSAARNLTLSLTPSGQPFPGKPLMSSPTGVTLPVFSPLRTTDPDSVDRQRGDKVNRRAMRTHTYAWNIDRTFEVAELAAKLLHNLFVCRANPHGERSIFNIAAVDLAAVFAVRQSYCRSELGYPEKIDSPLASEKDVGIAAHRGLKSFAASFES